MAFSRSTWIGLALGWVIAAPQCPGDEVDFREDVAPIIENHCIRCHKPGNEKGDLSLATRAGLIESGYLTPHKPGESFVLEVVTGSDDEPPRMPKEGKPLTKKQIDVLRRWIAGGARWPEGVELKERARADGSWWSLQPLSEAAPPEVSGAPAGWKKNPIDRFVFAKLAEKGLTPSGRADKRTLIRRAAYDLTGLPPTPEEVRAFLADTSPKAWEKLIDRLLASPHYGEQWGRHWLDVVRFGESRGFERNQIINNAWPFRDYVIRSFNEDKPFDRFVREHLAGDVLGPGDPAVRVGTTFLVAGPYDDVGNQDPQQAAQIRANTIDEIIRATGGAFLGLTVGCARCHDHKFDPITQDDYYALYATFAGVRHGEQEIATDEQRRERAATLKPLQKARAEVQRQIAEIDKAIAARAEQLAAARSRGWVRPPVARTGTEETFEPVTARFVRLVVDGTESNPNARSGYRIDEFEVWTAGENPRNVALAANGGTARGSSRVANDFSDAYSAQLTNDGKFGARWIAAGPELTIELQQSETVGRVLISSDRTGDAGTHPVAAFISEYRIEVSMDGKTWTEVANSRDRKPVNGAHRAKRLREAAITEKETDQLAALRREVAQIDAKIRAVPRPPVWWVGSFQPAGSDFHVFLGGNPQKKGKPVVPASLAALEPSGAKYELPKDSPEPARRMALADWIVDTKNPLTPRVLANRIWQYHFGTGLVATPSDFGYMGGRPSHPELLDWLARELHRSNWRLKPLHKRIMMSETYRQATAHRTGAAKVDAQSRLLWRFPPRRLTAEEIRDTMLAIAGKLDKRQGGPGFRLYRYIQDNVATYIPLDAPGPETYRRAVYYQNARAARVDLLTDFDCPDPAFAAPRRSATITPMQALSLMNHQFSLDMAGFLAERVQREAGEDRSRQITRLFELAYSREPEQQELDACVKVADKHGLRAVCRAVLNSNELIQLR